MENSGRVESRNHIEYKVNFLAPARGKNIVGIGKVVRAGRSITVCSGEVWAFHDGQEHLVAVKDAKADKVISVR